MINNPINLLLVEDNPGDARLLEETLDSNQFRLTHAQQLSQAVDCIKTAPADVILLDLSLPDSTGVETIQRIQSHAPDRPIVVLTGNDDEELALEAMRNGAQDYLVKGNADLDSISRSIRYAIERKKASEELRESHAFNQSLLATTPFGMDIVDEQGNVLFMNLAMERAVGKQVLDQRCWLAYKDDQQQCENCPLHQPIETGVTRVLESAGVLGGKIFEISHTGMFFHGKPALLEVFHDITLRKRAEEQIQSTLRDKELLLAQLSQMHEQLTKSHALLEELAIRDSLTGLYNRREMSRMLAEELIRNRRYGHPLALALLDIDDFKPVNDTYGHLVGDQVLKAFGRLLMESIRSMDRAVRYGGDEFAILLPDLDRAHGIETGERIRHLVAAHSFQVTLDDATRQTLSLTVSLGVASFPLDGDSEDALIAAADHAMYQAKRRGGNLVTP